MIISTVLTQNVMNWVYCQYISPLLHSTFYITETEFLGEKMVYYCKPIWSKIRNLSVQSLLGDDLQSNHLVHNNHPQQYIELSSLDTKKHLQEKIIGCSKLIVPKNSSTRPIAVLSKQHSVQIEENPSSRKRAKQSYVKMLTICMITLSFSLTRDLAHFFHKL